MALWMTVEQECFGLAALLLVFSCVFWRGDFRAVGRGKDKGRGPAFFAASHANANVRWTFILVVWIGLAAGAVRMEYEEWRVRTEQKEVGEFFDCEVWVAGQVVEIQEVDYGVRLRIRGCRLSQDLGNVGFVEMEAADTQAETVGVVRGLYVYADSTVGVRLGMWIGAFGTCELPEQDRNPGGFDYRLYCLSKGVCGICNADRVVTWSVSAAQEKVYEAEVLYWGLREEIRRLGLAFERQLEQIADKDDLGILKAVLLGQKSDMSDEIYELYRRNGISHVLAISGLHVSVIGMGLWKGLRKIGFGYLRAGILAFGVLLVYGIMTGFGPSVVRAVFMMGISFLAGIVGRTYDLPSAMCVPALGLLLWQPYLLTQASFQLTFLAVGAMFVPGGYLADLWGLEGMAKKIWVSISLQMITLPVVLAHSFEVPLFGVILNLVVVPLMSYVLVSGILGVAGSFLWYGLGIFLLGGAHCILGLYQSLCLGMQQVPGGNLILGCPEGIEILLYYSLIFGGIWLAGQKGKRWLILWGMGILLLVPWPGTGLSVTFLDVGQGDGIFLEAGGRTMLVDCGSSQEKRLGEDVLIPFLKSRGVGRLDTIVVSHGDQDHVSGIEELLGNADCGIEIGMLIFSAAGMEDEVCLELAKLAEQRGILVRYCGAGDSLTGALGGNVEILCLHPELALLGELEKDRAVRTGAVRNESSMVLHLSYENFSMLLTGDTGADVEQELMARYRLDPVTVLKAAHHGSAVSNCREFLERVRPAYVIFSYGEGNSYGHPAPQVVENCRETGAKIYETAQSGAVILWTDGKRMRIDGWLDRPGGI